MENEILKHIVAVSAGLSFFIGLFILLCPAQLKRVNTFLNTWISLRKMLKPLEMIRSVDDKIYRMHKVLGVLFLILTLLLGYCYLVL